MKLLHISDTHGFHSALDETIKMLVESNDIDVIIHSGDFMHHAMKYMDYESFIEWFKSLRIEHKILVPGNHDMWCEQLEFDQELRKAVVPDDVHLLINESIQIKGINFWGSPYTPEFFNWGFQLYGTEGYELWAKIPENTDVLITHGPSMGVLDMLPTGVSVGCPFLAQRIDELEIKAHLFGHIHDAYGLSHKANYVAANSAIMNEEYKPVNQPQIIDLNRH